MRLLLRADDEGAPHVPLAQGAVMLGRNATTGNTDPNVSREHAALDVRDDAVAVTALGMNAPMILRQGNPKPLQMKKGQTEVLKPGDAIVLLQSGKYKYTLVAADGEPLPPPPTLTRRSSLIEPQPYDAPPSGDVGDRPCNAAVKEDAPPSKRAKLRHEAPDIRPLCKYGADCYRHDRRHFHEYRHPHLPSMASEEGMAAECSDEGGSDGEATAAPPPAPAAATPPRTRPVCPYGAQCYRKGADHQAAFVHPAGSAPCAASDREPKPRNSLAEGDVYSVSTGLGQYKIKNAGGVYYCSCVAWRFQSAAVDERTCKHLVAFLGEEYMAWRRRHVAAPEVGGEAEDAVPPATPPKKSAPPGVLLADKWEESMDPTGWWLSEKLDGVRAYWDGARFLSRLGNTFAAPPYFTRNLPKDVVLDGELFAGRKKFQFAVGIVKSSSKSAMWRSLTYQVFDAPGLKKPFEERLAFLESRFGEGRAGEFVRIVEHVRCEGTPHLLAQLKEVEKMGGEGLMLRKPGSLYVAARSATLLKVKSFHDYEAKVLAHETGKGKNAHRTGALLCILPTGKKFSVGSGLTDRDRDRPPKIGSIITFRFQELTDSGVPRFPRYMGVRADAKWPPDSPWPP